MKNKKIAHLQLTDYNTNKFTLLTFLDEGSIVHRLYSGWGSSGASNSLSNLGCTLPVEPYEDETESMFVDRIVQIIDDQSTKKVIKRVSTNIKFAQ
jgi:hypothetical protein